MLVALPDDDGDNFQDSLVQALAEVNQSSAVGAHPPEHDTWANTHTHIHTQGGGQDSVVCSVGQGVCLSTKGAWVPFHPCNVHNLWQDAMSPAFPLTTLNLLYRKLLLIGLKSNTSN